MRRRLRNDAAAIVVAVALVGLTAGCNDGSSGGDGSTAARDVWCTQMGGHPVDLPDDDVTPYPFNWKCLRADGSQMPSLKSENPNQEPWEVDPMPQSDDREYPK